MLMQIFSRYSVDMEVHADINTNPNFKSNDALKEAMGYIVGMGLLLRPNRMPLPAPIVLIKWYSKFLNYLSMKINTKACLTAR